MSLILGFFFPMSILEAENQFNRRDGPQIVIPRLNGNITKTYKQDPSRH